MAFLHRHVLTCLDPQLPLPSLADHTGPEEGGVIGPGSTNGSTMQLYSWSRTAALHLLDSVLENTADSETMEKVTSQVSATPRTEFHQISSGSFVVLDRPCQLFSRKIRLLSEKLRPGKAAANCSCYLYLHNSVPLHNHIPCRQEGNLCLMSRLEAFAYLILYFMVYSLQQLVLQYL